MLNLDEFQIGKYEVTNLQYAQCVKADICVGRVFGEDKALHPVVNVTWYDAKTYCEWTGGRLPTEAEWEKAARGTDERTYPWGNSDPTSDLLNYNGNINDTMPVGKYPDGVSPYGVYDLAGNVYEWVSSLYQPYPYDAADGREELSSSDSRVLRGGSWDKLDLDNYARSADRNLNDPSYPNDSVGFRCARSP